MDQTAITEAPGGPGLAPRWTSSAKSGVGTALSPLSRVWFTLSHGILNEIYYPRVDQACTRDFGLIITDGMAGGFFAEEKRDADSRLATNTDGVPSFRVTNTCRDQRFTIEKHIIADPRRDVVLQRTRFTDHGIGAGPALKIFALLAPHLVNGGANNTAWTDDYKGEPMLFAEGDGTALALACSTPWLARSVGFVGVSDGWQLLHAEGKLARQYNRAANGNVALCGEVDLSAGAEFVLAIGFGSSWSEAAFRARASLQRSFAEAEAEYSEEWRAWHGQLRPLRGVSHEHDTYRISASILRAHDSPSFPGGIIASLSIPWGFNKGDDDLGGYHLVWPRDLVETAGGLIAAGALEDARRVLDYLRATQEVGGGWPQNCWLDGVPYWRGIQLDECAFPLLLLDMLWRHGGLRQGEIGPYWEMARRAIGYVLRTGPVTGQDRWEEDGGYSPFTLAVLISALIAAADLCEIMGDAALATLCRDTADAWNAMIETWCYATDTPLARAAGVDGHYVRIAPAREGTALSDLAGKVQIRNRAAGETEWPVAAIVSPDALALVRFGLRAADDPRIVSTVAVIDHLLRRELPEGPCWYRYNADGYGEHADGAPFDGTGIGRLWPLMTGERAHYELAAGRIEEARRLLQTMEQLTGDGALIPEQIWDSDDIPDRELTRGRPSGSAMPLVWAHAEHVKLIRSLADGTVFDMPPATALRYRRQGGAPRVQPWRPDWRPDSIVSGRVLRLDLPHGGGVLWSTNGWETVSGVAIADSGTGLFVAEIPTQEMQPGTVLSFRSGMIEGSVSVR